MASTFIKTLLIATSLAPVFFAVFIAAFSKCVLKVPKFLGSLEPNQSIPSLLLDKSLGGGDLTMTIVTLFIAFALCGLGKAILWRGERDSSEDNQRTYEKLEPADGDITGFLVSLLIPVIIIDTSSVNILTIAMYALFFFALSWFTNAYKANPVFGLLGYSTFKITAENGTTFTLLSRRKLRSASSVSLVTELSDFLLVDRPNKQKSGLINQKDK